MKIPVLIYHKVLPSEDLARAPRRERFYSISSETFDDHLRFLHAQGFQTIRMGASPSDVCRSVVLTFDDGFQSAYRCYRILNNYGFHGIFFIVTDFVGRESYLSWDEILEMHANGMSIQSHTCSHMILTDMTTDRIETEFSVSRAILEEKLGQRVDCLSIPHGFANKEVIDIARRCGYEYIFTSQPGLYSLESRAPIPRLSIYNHTRVNSFCRLVHQSGYEIGKQRMRKLVLSIPKKILGDRIYHQFHLRIMQWFDR